MNNSDINCGEQSVLMITSQFPPLKGMNVQRIFKLAKYLPEFSWNPIIITVEVSKEDESNSVQLKELQSNIRIIRSRNLDPFVWIGHLRKKEGQTSFLTTVSKKQNGQNSDTHGLVGKRKNLIRKIIVPASELLKQLFRQMLYIPDNLTPWVPMAVWDGIRMIKKNDVKVIVSSCPSYSGHLVGLIINYLTDIPWIADFTDLWVGRPYRLVRNRFHSKLDSSMEKVVVQRADKIIVTSPCYQKIFEQIYDKINCGKISCITMGYDPLDFKSSVHSTELRKKIRIVNAGYNFDQLSPFLRVLGRIQKKDNSLLEDLDIIFMGSPQPNEQHQLQLLVESLFLNSVLQFMGRVPHSDCIKYQREADLLLLLHEPKHMDTIRGQSFENMAALKPIFAIVPLQGVLAEYIQQSGLAVCAQQGDINDIESKFTKMITMLQQGKLNFEPNLEYIKQFDQRNLTSKFVQILHELAENNKS